jgi:hypothetical protein
VSIGARSGGDEGAVVGAWESSSGVDLSLILRVTAVIMSHGSEKRKRCKVDAKSTVY